MIVDFHELDCCVIFENNILYRKSAFIRVSIIPRPIIIYIVMYYL